MNRLHPAYGNHASDVLRRIRETQEDANPGCTPRCKDGWIWVRHGDDVAHEPCDICNPDGRR